MDEPSPGHADPTAAEDPAVGIPAPKINIYREYILPFIESAEKSDSIYFVSPSTFFGFDSLGAGNFEAVCLALKAAKERGVRIQILIDVRDTFAAKAAEGLLLILVDGEEIKDLPKNEYQYRILVHKPDGKSLFAAFDSDPPRMLPYLPGIHTRRFRKVRAPDRNTPEEDAQEHIRYFQFLWRLPPTRTVWAAIYLYSPEFRTRLKFVNLQQLSYAVTFFCGMLIGIFLMVQSTSKYTALFGVIVSLALGVMSNLLTNYFTKKRFD